MPRGTDLDNRVSHLKTATSQLNLPAQFSQYEAFRQELLVVQERAYKIARFSEDYQNKPPEWYEVENLWDMWAEVNAHNKEAELTYSTVKRAYVCDGVDLGETLARSRELLAGWLRVMGLL